MTQLCTLLSLALLHLAPPAPSLGESEDLVAPEPQRDPGPAPLLVSGGTMLAGGIMLTAFGIREWARGVRAYRDDAHVMLETLDYRSAGKTMVGFGVASLAIGATLMSLEIVRARKARQRNHLGIDVTARYFGLRLAGRF